MLYAHNKSYMIIGGLQKFSLLDYPGNISAIIFTQGCNFRCHFCYNPLLVGPVLTKEQLQKNTKSQEIKKSNLVSETALFDFLKSRVNKLDAVVVTGGEPTLHKDLPRFLKEIKDFGFKVKLDTNGTNPTMIKQIIEEKLVDYIAMDIKAPLEKYELAVDAKIDLDKIKESVIIIKESGLLYEFRTTVTPGIIEESDIKKMAKIISQAEKWYLQKFKSDIELVDSKFEGKKAFTDEEMQKMKNIALKYVKKCEIR